MTVPLILLCAVFLGVLASGFRPVDQPDPPAAPPCSANECVPKALLVRSEARSRKLLKRLGRMERARNNWRRLSRAGTAPTVEYAITLASAVFGVPEWQIRAVGTCESHLDPFATNGKYKGVMQLGWRPFGLSPFDPIANVLSAAQTVAHDGSWRQWECKP